MQIKEGGWYKRRDGEIVGPAEPNRSQSYPWRIGEFCFTHDGYCSGRPSLRLSCEVPPPLDGYRPTGEFRVPDREPYYSPSRGGWTLTAVGWKADVRIDDGKRWIAEKMPDEAKPKPVDNPIVANASKLAAFADRMESDQSEAEELTEADVEATAKSEVIDAVFGEGVAKDLQELNELAAQSDGWIDWPGGEQPVDDETRVQVRFRSGVTSDEVTAGNIMWGSANRSFDTVAYRVVPADQPAEPEKQPQPGEWWEYSLKGLRGVAYCCGQFLNGRLLWQEHPKGGAVQLGESLIRHLPKCTGFDYVPPPEQTPAERRLTKAGLKYEGGERYSATSGDRTELLIITTEQAEAMIAHKLEREGGAE